VELAINFDLVTRSTCFRIHSFRRGSTSSSLPSLCLRFLFWYFWRFWYGWRPTYWRWQPESRATTLLKFSRFTFRHSSHWEATKMHRSTKYRTT